MKKTAKIKRMLPFLGLLAALFALLALTGCSGSQLARPNGLYVDDISQTLTLNWNNVQYASGYEVELNGSVTESRRSTFSMDELEPGSYQIRVRAKGDGMRYVDSAWSEPISYQKDADSGLRYRPVDNYTAYEVAGLGTASGEVTVDDTYRGRPVVRIAESAFSGATELTGIVMGKNITAIGKRAFANCTNLTGVTLNEGLTSVGEYAFQRCIALENVTLPDSLTAVSDYCFASCEQLKEVSFGSGVQSVGLYAFSNTGLTSLTLPDQVTSLSDYAFYNCASLETLT